MPQGSRHFFPSSSRPFGPSRPNQTFLHSFNQSLPPPPSYRLSFLSLLHSFTPSLFLSSRHQYSFLLLLDVLRLSAGSSTFARVCVSTSLARRFDLASSASPSILWIIRVSRNLILRASPCLTPTLISCPSHTRVYLFSSNLVEGFRPVRSGIMGS